ncbi:MAG: lipoyl(octanoyl) transferase LipB [Betaproteobacteria bacterium]|nr:lipoyl(octanoyl) transferase LipB [Betaproteobacteria bacterium]
MKIRHLGRRPCAPVLAEMQAYSESRSIDAPDELWLVEHDPVYTQGLAGRSHHVLAAGDIAVLRTNRGGQVTYHGPGQVVAYPLVDLRRRGLRVKEYVFRLEASILAVLGDLGITGHRVAGAPGIYVRLDAPASHAALTGPQPSADPFRGLGKIAALGVKVTRHCAYHGAALNVAMDLEPYSRINPCGYEGLRTVDLAFCGVQAKWDQVARRWAECIQAHLEP